MVKKARAKTEAVRIEVLRKAQEEMSSQAEGNEEETSPKKKRRKSKRTGKRSGSETPAQNKAGESAEAEDGDHNLEELRPEDYIPHMTSVRDNPDQVAAEIRKESQAFRAENRKLLNEPELNGDDLADLILEVGKDGMDDMDDNAEKEENRYAFDGDPDEVRELYEKEENDFDAWDDRDATVDYLGKRYFSEEERLLKLTAGQMRERVNVWLRDREPREVVREINIVEAARQQREMSARIRVEDMFEDIDDEELEAYYTMKEGDLRARARLWLSQNGKWLEENKGGPSHAVAQAPADSVICRETSTESGV